MFVFIVLTASLTRIRQIPSVTIIGEIGRFFGVLNLENDRDKSELTGSQINDALRLLSDLNCLRRRRTVLRVGQVNRRNRCWTVRHVCLRH